MYICIACMRFAPCLHLHTCVCHAPPLSKGCPLKDRGWYTCVVVPRAPFRNSSGIGRQMIEAMLARWLVMLTRWLVMLTRRSTMLNQQSSMHLAVNRAQPACATIHPGLVVQGSFRPASAQLLGRTISLKR